MSTHTAYRDCIVCTAPLAVEIAYEAGFGPAGVDVLVLPEQLNIVEIQCGHAPRNLAWLSTADGFRWCAARVDEARIEGALT